MKTNSRIVAISLTLFSCLHTVPVEAGQITGFTWSSGVASVAGIAAAPPVAINNDDVVGESPNKLIIAQKHYTGIGPVDIEFSVSNTGGTTEYFFEEGVDNSTLFAWSSYRMELGFGMGAGFVPSTAGDGLDFDAPDYSSAPDFTTFFASAVNPTEDVVLASGGLHPNGGGYSLPPYTFSIDVPDGITAFTLRQQPIAVPEPSSLWLALLGGLGLARLARS
jgi:hypothetical protein